MSDGKVRGIVHVVEETKTYGQNGFRKRLVVLEQDKGRFTNYVPVEFTNDNCDGVDGLSVGDEIEIDYQLNGRRWQKDANSEVKFFLNAEAMSFSVVKGTAEGAAERNASSESPQSNTPNSTSANDELAEAAFDDEDVPF